MREMGAPQTLDSVQRLRCSYLRCEVDAGSPVEKELGHVEVLIVSCDVERCEARLAQQRGRMVCHTPAPLSQNQPRVSKQQ